MAGYRNLHTSVFSANWLILSAIEISVIQSTGNKLHFSISCETTLLMLSCDHIESVKLIHVASKASILHSSPSYFSKCSHVNILSASLPTLTTPHNRSNCTTSFKVGIKWQNYIRTYVSSSSYRAGSTDIPDPLSSLLPIVHRPR